MSLAELPPELIIRIVDFIDPSDHLHFALTSKYLSQCSRDILRLHQAYAKEFFVASDLRPLSFIALVRRVISDPLAAYHVRHLEFYTARDGTYQWRELTRRQILLSQRRQEEMLALGEAVGIRPLGPPRPETPENLIDEDEAEKTPHEDENGCNTFWPQDELDYFESCFDAFYPGFAGPEDLVASWDDLGLKMVLVTHCPRLNSVYTSSPDDNPE